MSRRSKYIILFLFLAVFLVLIPLVAFFHAVKVAIPSGGKRMAVVLELHGSFLEYQPYFSPGMFFGQKEPTLTELLTCIESAGRDRRVESLVLKISQSGAGAAKCEEIREAIHRFREGGKNVLVFSRMMANNHYLMACSADSLFMPPSGYLLLTGASSSAVFLKGTLEKLGISPNIHRIEDYKSAAEMFTEKERTPASKEMVEWLLEDRFSRLVEGIAEERGRDVREVRSWIDRGLFSPRRAVERGLIDGIRYWDQIRDSFEGRGVTLVSAAEYTRSAGSPVSMGYGPKVAVVHAQGTIVSGRSGFDPVGGLLMGSETIAKALRRAREDDRVRAVVMRIDSPGGDGLAGEVISREVELTSREKPVVVSMSDVAASGGYEIAYRADRIIAMPGSLTGSIGSITGKMNYRDFYNKLGITKDETGIGEKALMLSDYRDFTEAEWGVVEEEHWEFYTNWIRDIARFRGMSVGRVDSLAGGRVWSGRQAFERDLVDGLGGLQEAVEVACQLAGVEDSERVALFHYPKRLSLLQLILSGDILVDYISYRIHRAVGESLWIGDGLFLMRVAPGFWVPRRSARG